MKSNPTSGLIAQLSRIKADLDTFADPESKSKFLVELNGLIARLVTLRDQLERAAFENAALGVAEPLALVIEFLQATRDDPALAALISDALRSRPSKPQRAPVHIPPNLTNDQIREFLAQELSKSELKELAAQRGISAGKRSDEDVRRDILRVLERQEGYERLARPRI